MAEEKEIKNLADSIDLGPNFDPAEYNDVDPLALEDEGTEWDELLTERDNLKDRLMRTMAEAENTRKRGERDRRDAEVYGGSKLARDMLSVYDNMNRALETVDDAQRESSKALIEGIELTMRELLSTFAKHKIVQLNPEIGEKFDPKLHQAMFEAPIEGAQAGHIIQTMAVGFVIGERLLRPAQVGVASTPPKQGD